MDTLQFVDGINQGDVNFYFQENDLFLSGRRDEEWFQITVRGQFASDSAADQIERFVFADGTVMTAQEVKARMLTVKAPNWANDLYGFGTSDEIAGGWGDDHISGLSGADTLHGDQGADDLRGDSGADQLFGDAGNDTLLGGDGDDTLLGGTGWDRLTGEAGNDTYTFGLGQGNDVIAGDISGVDRVLLAAGLTAANVTLHRVSAPPAADIAFTGDALVIQLNSGLDQLWIANYFATGTAGYIESLQFTDGTIWDYAAITARLVSSGGVVNAVNGTSKANTFSVDHWGDVINDSTLFDGDKVTASVSYDLPEGVNDLTLTGALNLFAVGSSASDILRGNAGSNWFDFTEGQGSDTLAGGKGDDVYRINSLRERVEPDANPAGMGGVVITELVDEGTDTLVSGFWSCKLPDNVENLILGTPNETDGSLRYYLSGKKNIYTHLLIGNTLNNIVDASLYEEQASGQWWFGYRSDSAFSSIDDFRLDGGGGADTLIGGLRDDTYVIDNVGDVVVELGVADGRRNYSNDTVETPFEASLSQLPYIENITLVGSNAVNATGDGGDNILSGSLNTAINYLTGGTGDDTYVVGAGDVVVELAGEGVDTVLVAASASTLIHLADFENVENLRLLDGAGATFVEGHDGVNVLTGGSAGERLAGLGGDDTIYDQYQGTPSAYSYLNVSPSADNDTLEGGTGNDRLTSYGGVDVMDGGAGDDVLDIRGAVRNVTVLLGLGEGHDTVEQQPDAPG
ncbi:calcium-binding protein, partial [Caldilinea sp.]|uniref:calcium-binding protein n=1 Tax=Caldilinea sp. TaxID=2293560 RepID=UPI002BC8F0FD|nr:calcium-binding protein [Caldilinea sp.]